MQFSLDFRCGTSLVTCLHSFCGSKLQVSSGTSTTTWINWYGDDVILKRNLHMILQAMYTSCLILLAYGSCFFSAFFWSWFNWTSSWSTKLEGNLLAFCYWRKFLYLSIFNTTFFHWPFSTLLSSRVSLGNIFAFFFIDIFTIGCIISDIMLFISIKWKYILKPFSYSYFVKYWRKWVS